MSLSCASRTPQKLAQYIGRSIKLLIERKDEPWAFRIHKSRVYYMPESLLRQAAPVAKKQLVSVGTCFGKFSASMKFKCERGGAFSRVFWTPFSSHFGGRAGFVPAAAHCPHLSRVVLRHSFSFTSLRCRT